MGHFYMDLTFLKTKGIEVAPSTKLHLPMRVAPPVKFYGGTLTHSCSLDAFSYISPNCILHAVDIGRYCSIGDAVAILSNHPTDRLSTHPFTYESIFAGEYSGETLHQLPFSDKLPRTTIGHDVWIGSNVKIIAGVAIGDGCIVGAGSLVTKDLPPFSIVGGVPAKLIRMRFDDHLIERIQSTRWWQFNLLNVSLPWCDIACCLQQLELMVANNEISPHKPG
jgi:acetyltransferase-like isoleucine patch superfamily enzyme